MNTPRRAGESDTALFFRNIAMASFSASVSEAVTIPLDTAKVRLQI